MNRLIDEIQSEIKDKNILGEISHICLTDESLQVLIEDFKEEFQVEYEELGRKPTYRDVQEYLNVPIMVQKLNGEKQYSLLKEV
jgi:hypothetical protein